MFRLILGKGLPKYDKVSIYAKNEIKNKIDDLLTPYHLNPNELLRQAWFIGK